MQHTRESIIRLLETNDLAVARAVLALTERQTADEKSAGETRHHNGRGWRPCHSRMGTSMAEGFIKYGKLTPKQVAYWRKPMRCGNMRIGIYWRQLLEIAQAREAARVKTSAAQYVLVRG